MASHRDIIRKARGDLHRKMRVSALYIETPTSEPLPVTVRVHSKFVSLGDQKGTNFNSAEREDVAPRIVFLVAEVPSPKRNAVVSVEPGEAYLIDASEPPDDITVTAFATRMPASEVAGLPLPEPDNG